MRLCLAGALLLGGCALSSAYVPNVPPGTGAGLRVERVGPPPESGWQGNLDVYDFEAGCPEFNARMRSSGYRGSVDLSSRPPRPTTLASGKPLVLKNAWVSRGFFSTASCDALAVFVPVQGGRYVLRFFNPSEREAGCGLQINQIIKGADGEDDLVVDETVAYPESIRDLGGLRSAEICAVGKELIDSPPDGSIASPRPAAPAGPDRFAPLRPGTTAHLALGFAFGGDDVLKATFTSGADRTITGGKGVYGTLGASVTPLWLGQSLGLGLAGEIGWKVDSVGAKNATINLSRFPTALWLQTLAALGGRWWFQAGAGVATDLSPTLSGDLETARLKQDFDASWGWLGQAGFYFHEGRHTGVGLGLRYTRLRYRFGAGQPIDTVIDASSVGFGVTLHARP